MTPRLAAFANVRATGGERFTFAERGLGLVDEDGVAAEGVDAGLEAEAGAEGGLLEEEHHLFGIESVAEVVGVVLDGVGELHYGGHLLYGEIGDGAEIAAGEATGWPVRAGPASWLMASL